jgi:hypothetical protein
MSGAVVAIVRLEFSLSDYGRKLRPITDRMRDAAPKIGAGRSNRFSTLTVFENKRVEDQEPRIHSCAA